ncbi:MAG: hypothetical protein AAGH88_00435 [Planctomycetota bacterium]
MQLLISGAEQGNQGAVGVKAVLCIVDTETGETLHETTYTPPPSITHPEQKIQFTGFSWIGPELFVCTHNHIVVYDQWPPERPVRIISQPGFNDLHHCYPWQGHLAVSNTGLETVDLIDVEGKLLERWDLLPDAPGKRTIDPSLDYRMIPDTKPHLRHGNHLFEFGGQLWTSQLRTSNAVCVSDLSQTLEMGVGMPHDGEIINDHLVFTTTNGHLVRFDLAEGRTSPAEPFNLTAMTPELDQLGWCRGVYGIPDRRNCYWVGFSALRRSKWKDFGFWIKHGHHMPRSRITRYDLTRQQSEVTWMIGSELPGLQIFQLGACP